MSVEEEEYLNSRLNNDQDNNSSENNDEYLDCEQYNHEDTEEFEENIENEEGEHDLDEFEEDDVFYFKYEFEGCQNIDDILANLDRLKELFGKFKNEGYNLREDVSGGYCFLYKEE